MKRKLDEMVKAPKRRYGLPCYDKSLCQISHCSEVDRVVPSMHKIFRQPCDKDCKRRVNLEKVPIRVCLKSKCAHFDVEYSYCKKYIEEERRRHKPPPFQFAKGLRTPSSGNRGFYGHKRLDGKGFI